MSIPWVKEKGHVFHRHATDREGYWGEPTSTLDWCEENYAYTDYIAEFWNATSNLFYIAVGVGEVIRLWRLRGRLFKSSKIVIRKRFLIAFALLTLVGAGSFGFHSTLLYPWQMMDEVPMLFMICHLVYCLRDDPPRLLWIWYALPFVTSGVHVVWGRPLAHQIVFAAVVVALGLDGIRRLRPFSPGGIYPTLLQTTKNPTPNPNPKPLVCSEKERVSAMSVIRPVRRLLATSSAMLIFAFILWNIDNTACTLLHAQHKKPVLRALLQLHAWWHVLSMLAGFYAITGIMIYDTWRQRVLLHQQAQIAKQASTTNSTEVETGGGGLLTPEATLESVSSFKLRADLAGEKRVECDPELPMKMACAGVLPIYWPPSKDSLLTLDSPSPLKEDTPI